MTAISRIVLVIAAALVAACSDPKSLTVGQARFLPPPSGWALETGESASEPIYIFTSTDGQARIEVRPGCLTRAETESLCALHPKTCAKTPKMLMVVTSEIAPPVPPSADEEPVKPSQSPDGGASVEFDGPNGTDRPRMETEATVAFKRDAVATMYGKWPASDDARYRPDFDRLISSIRPK